MRIAILYTVWTGDDMEMLRRSIRQHYDYVDQIHIWWQDRSNRNEVSENTFFDSNVISEDSKIHYHYFTPDIYLSTKANERMKHDYMIQQAKKQGFTHFILCACDHFYEPAQFEWAKKYHQEKDVDVSFTMMRTYYKHKNWFLDPMEYYYMPFIHRMSANTEISKDIKYPVRVDPSVKVNNCVSWRVFTPEECLLHHYSMVRKDIKKKLRNAASSIRWTPNQVETFIREYENAKPGDSITYFQGRKIVEIQK